MRTIPLPLETKALTSFNRKLILTYQDFIGTGAWTSAITSGTAQAIIPDNNTFGSTTNNMVAKCRVSNWLINVVAAFTSSGGAITTLTFSLGDGGSATRFLNAIDLKTAGYTLGTVAQYLYTAADTIDMTVTIAGQTMASLITGSIEIYYDEVDLLNGLPYVSQP